MYKIILNSLGICVVGSLGMLVKNRIKQRQIDALNVIIATLVLVTGLQGVIKADNLLPVTMSLFFGTLIGSSIQIEDKIIDKVTSLASEEGSDLVNGIIAISLINCMGSLAILGPLNIALNNDHTIMNFKIILDCLTSLVFGTIYGKSIYPASIVLFFYQMMFFVLGKLITPILNEVTVNQIGQIGSVMLILLSMNLLQIKKIKIMDLIPSLIFPILFGLVNQFIG